MRKMSYQTVERYRVEVEASPALHSDANYLAVQLYDGHKDTAVAGVSCAERWTGWKQAVLELDRVVAEHPEGIRVDRVQGLLPVEFRDMMNKRTLAQGLRQGWSVFKKCNTCVVKEKRDGRQRLILYTVKF